MFAVGVTATSENEIVFLLRGKFVLGVDGYQWSTRLWDGRHELRSHRRLQRISVRKMRHRHISETTVWWKARVHQLISLLLSLHAWEARRRPRSYSLFWLQMYTWKFRQFQWQSRSSEVHDVLPDGRCGFSTLLQLNYTIQCCWVSMYILKSNQWSTC